MNKTRLIPILAVLVIAVFLTNSAYAYTTKLSGSGTCSPYTGCYYTITTSNGTGRVVNTFMNATHTVTGVALYGQTTRHLVAEHVNATSVLVGDNINTISVKLQGLGSPPGFFQVGVFDANQNVKRLFANVSASTLATTGFKVYKFTTGSNYTISPDDYIGVFYNATGSDSTNKIAIMRDNYTGFDGSNSQEQYYDTKWHKDGVFDAYMLLQNVGVQQPAWLRTGYGGYAISFILPGETNVTQSNTGYSTTSTIVPSTKGTSYLIKGNFTETDVNTGKIVNGTASYILNISGHSGRGGGIIYKYSGGSVVIYETPQFSHYTQTVTYCNPSSTALGNYTTCYANVTNLAKQYTKTPTGTVSFSQTNGGIGSFSPTSCTLSHGSCHVKFKASLEVPGASAVYANYLGDSGHLPSQGTTELYVTGTPVDDGGP